MSGHDDAKIRHHKINKQITICVQQDRIVYMPIFIGRISHMGRPHISVREVA